MHAHNDAALIDEVRRGNRQAFGALVERYQSVVYSVCLRLLGNPADAEDLAQEAFLRAYWRIDQVFPQYLPHFPGVLRALCGMSLFQIY